MANEELTRSEYLTALLNQRRTFSASGNNLVNPSVTNDVSSLARVDTSFNPPVINSKLNNTQAEINEIQKPQEQRENNILSSIFGFVDEIAAKFGAGFVGAWEGILDLGATALGAITGNQVFTDWAKQDIATNLAEWTKTYANFTPWGIVQSAKNFGNGEYWNDMLEGAKDIGGSGLFMSNQIGDYRQDANRYYGYNDEVLDEMGQAGQFLGGVAHSIGFMLPSIMTGGAAAGAMKGSQAAVALGKEAVTLGSMGLSATGKGSEEALNEGATAGQALAYGAASGAVEVVSEIAVGKVLGKIGLGTGAIGGLVGGKTSKSFVTNFVKTMNEEGMEEVFSALMQPLTESIYKGKVDAKGTYGNVDWWFGTNGHFNESVLGQYASGAITAGITNMVQQGSVYKKVGKNGLEVISTFGELTESDADYAKGLLKGKTVDGKATAEAFAKFTSALDNFWKNATDTQRENMVKYLTQEGVLARDLDKDFTKDQNALTEYIATNYNDFNKRYTNSQVREVLKSIYKSDVNIQYQARADLQADIEKAFGKKVNTDAYFNKDNNTMYISNEILNEKGGQKFVHEVFGHAFGDFLSIEQQTKLVDEMSKTETGKKAIKYVDEHYSKQNVKARNEEIIAHFLEFSAKGDNIVQQFGSMKKIFANENVFDKLLNLFNKVKLPKDSSIAKKYAKLLKNVAEATSNSETAEVIRKAAEKEKLTSKEEKIANKYKTVVDFLQGTTIVEETAYALSKNETSYKVSPIVQQGSKKRILNQIMPLFAKNITGKFYDLFTGTGTVALNMEGNVVANDSNPYAYNMLKALSETRPSDVISHINEVIEQYNLRTQEGYEKFVKEWNKSKTKNYIDLFVIGKFTKGSSVEVDAHGDVSYMYKGTDGKFYTRYDSKRAETTLKSKADLREQLNNLYKSDIDYQNKDYLELLEQAQKGDFVYADPPYDNTKATYNNDWNRNDTIKLLEALDKATERGVKWAMSNVLSFKGAENEHIREWAKKYEVHEIEGVKYYGENAEEVLIRNYDNDENIIEPKPEEVVKNANIRRILEGNRRNNGGKSTYIGALSRNEWNGENVKRIGESVERLLQQEIDSGTDSSRIDVIVDNYGKQYLVGCPNLTYNNLKEIVSILKNGNADMKKTAQMLSEHSLEEFKKAKFVITSADGLQSLAVMEDGDIVNVLNKNQLSRNFIEKVFPLAFDNGGTHLDCYNLNEKINLPFEYSKVGMIPASGVVYNDTYIEDEEVKSLMNKSNDKNAVVMMIYSGKNEKMFATRSQIRTYINAFINRYAVEDWDKAVQIRNKFSYEQFDKNMYSLFNRDALGNYITKEVYRYFYRSVVRDNEGRLIPLYHGTSSKEVIDVFNSAKAFASYNNDGMVTYQRLSRDTGKNVTFLADNYAVARSYINDLSIAFRDENTFTEIIDKANEIFSSKYNPFAFTRYLENQETVYEEMEDGRIKKYTRDIDSYDVNETIFSELEDFKDDIVDELWKASKDEDLSDWTSKSGIKIRNQIGRNNTYTLYANIERPLVFSAISSSWRNLSGLLRNNEIMKIVNSIGDNNFVSFEEAMNKLLEEKNTDGRPYIRLLSKEISNKKGVLRNWKLAVLDLIQDNWMNVTIEELQAKESEKLNHLYNQFLENGDLRQVSEMEADKAISRDISSETFYTDDAVAYAMTQGDYDGIIVTDVRDSGEMDNDLPVWERNPTFTEYITVGSSNQLKLVSNKAPTKNPNIKLSINDDIKMNDIVDDFTDIKRVAVDYAVSVKTAREAVTNIRNTITNLTQGTMKWKDTKNLTSYKVAGAGNLEGVADTKLMSAVIDDIMESQVTILVANANNQLVKNTTTLKQYMDTYHPSGLDANGLSQQLVADLKLYLSTNSKLSTRRKAFNAFITRIRQLRDSINEIKQVKREFFKAYRSVLKLQEELKYDYTGDLKIDSADVTTFVKAFLNKRVFTATGNIGGSVRKQAYDLKQAGFFEAAEKSDDINLDISKNALDWFKQLADTYDPNRKVQKVLDANEILGYTEVIQGIRDIARKAKEDFYTKVEIKSKKLFTQYGVAKEAIKLRPLGSKFVSFSQKLMNPIGVMRLATLGLTDLNKALVDDAIQAYDNKKLKQAYMLGKLYDIIDKTDVQKNGNKKVEFNIGRHRRYDLYALYMNLKAEYNRASLEQEGYSIYDAQNRVTRNFNYYDDLEVDLNKALTDNEKETLDAMLNLLNSDEKGVGFKAIAQEAGEKISSFFQVIDGTYYPMTLADAEKKLDPSKEQQIYAVDASGSSYLKERTGARSRVKLVNPVNLLSSYIDSLTNVLYVSETVKEITRLLNKKVDGKLSVLDQIKSFNPDFQSQYSSFMNKLLGKSVIKGTQPSFVDNLAGYYSTAVLGLNVGSILTQGASLPTGMNLTGIKSGLKALLKKNTFDIRKAHKWLLEHNGTYAMRVMEHGLINGLATTNEFLGNANTVLRKIATGVLTPMEKADQLWALIEFGMAQQTIADTMGSGYEIGSEKNLEESNKLFTRVILETMSNSDSIAKSMLRSGEMGDLNRFVFGMFASDAQQKYSLLVEKLVRHSRIKQVIKRCEALLENPNFKENTEDYNAVNELYEQAKKELAKFKVELPRYGATLIASGVIAFLAKMLRDWLYGRKEPKDYVAEPEEFFKSLALETFVDWIPYVGQIASYLDYGSMNVMPLQTMLSLIDNGKGLIDALRTGNKPNAYITNLILQLAQFLGIPANNVKNIILGIIKNADPESAIKAETLLYGRSSSYLSLQYGEALKVKNERRALGFLATGLDTYRVNSSSNAVKEINRIYSDGYHDVLPKQYMTEYVNEKDETVKLTQAEIDEFRKIYDRADKDVEREMSLTEYSSLTNEERAKVLKKIYDAYYYYARASVLKGKAETKLANVLKLTGGKLSIAKYALFLNKISSITETRNKTRKEQVIEYINHIRGMSKSEKLLLMYLAGYSVSGSSQSQLINYLSTQGAKRKEIIELFS